MQGAEVGNVLNEETKEIMVKLVSSLLARKPKDPVPHIYSYLKEV